MTHTIWNKEPIPDTDKVYCFIHCQANVNPRTGRPRAAAFHNTPKQGDNLSCDTIERTVSLLVKKMRKRG